MTTIRHLLCKLGLRGCSLLVAFAVDLVFAYSLMSPSPVSVHTPIYLWLAGLAPLGVWAVLFAAVGLVCLYGAFARDDRVPFVCAVILKVFWALLNLGASLIAHVERAYVNAALWLAMAAWVYLISIWPEPPRTQGCRRTAPPPHPDASPGGD